MKQEHNMTLSPTASKLLPKRFDPVGLCIYCGAAPPTPLTKEHIIPQGLGGGLILPQSSCEKCRRITQKFEETSLRSMSLLTYRLKAELVQHLHEIPDRARQQPHFLLLPVPEGAPGILAGRPLGTPMRYHLQLAANVVPTRLPNVDVISYFRMIAKIAHSFAVSQIGIDGFDAHLPHIILGNQPVMIPYLIGISDATLPVRPNALSHQIGLGLIAWGGGHLVRVRVQLFAFNRGPAYDAVAGTLSISQEHFESRVHALLDPNPGSIPRRPFDKTRVRPRRVRATRVR
jgi:hypothetical protein